MSRSRLTANILLRILLLQAPLLGILALAAFVQGIPALGIVLLVAAAACFFVGRRAKKPDQLRAEGLLKRPPPRRPQRVARMAFAALVLAALWLIQVNLVLAIAL